MPRQNISGMTFGRWTAIAEVRQYYWSCQCACGSLHDVYEFDLKSGKSTKCERCAQHKHGHASGGVPSKTYTTWMCMKRRCSDPDVNDYDRYGGSGVTVCERWHVFSNFLQDMGERPAGKILDRIRSTGNYEPGNCRWATPKESAANRRPRGTVVVPA